jgi:hypothetical protein
MEFVKIVLFCLGAAIAYGILHDQVTAHLCVEYFTIAHAPLFPTRSPFLMAVGWGIVGTSWVGLPLGLTLAAAARIGSHRKLALSDLRGLILRLLAAMAVLAIVAGAVSAYLVATGNAPVPGGWALVIPPAKHVAFSAAAWAHMASHVSGTLGGLLVIGCVIRRRMRSVVV